MDQAPAPPDHASTSWLSYADLERVFLGIRPDLVRMLTRRTGSAATAADLSQDMFEKLATVRALIPDDQRARSYLFRVAGNLAIDHRRVAARRQDGAVRGPGARAGGDRRVARPAAAAGSGARRAAAALPRGADALPRQRAQAQGDRRAVGRVGQLGGKIPAPGAAPLSRCASMGRVIAWGVMASGGVSR